MSEGYFDEPISAWSCLLTLPRLEFMSFHFYTLNWVLMTNWFLKHYPQKYQWMYTSPWDEMDCEMLSKTTPLYSKFLQSIFAKIS